MSEISTGAGDDGSRPYGMRGPDFTPPGRPGVGAEGTADAAAPGQPAAGIPAQAAAPGAGSVATGGSRRSSTVTGGLLLAGGLLAGIVAAGLGQGSDSAAATTTASSSTTSTQQGQGQLGQGQQDGTTGMQPPDGGFGGRGGAMAGETRVIGTITAVGSDSLTVQGTDGSTATYAVDDTTQIVTGTGEVALSQLEAGEQVLVHVLADGAGDVTAERVLVGTVTTQGPGGGRSGLPPGLPGSQDGSGTQDPGTQDDTGAGGTGTQTGLAV